MARTNPQDGAEHAETEGEEVLDKDDLNALVDVFSILLEWDEDLNQGHDE